MKKYNISGVLVLFFLLSLPIKAQVKDEREMRISSKEFPEVALQYLNRLPEDIKRLKFYKETDGSKTSFEAKFKYRRKLFSVEFTNEGVLEDIEAVNKLKKIDRIARQNIEAYFKSNFKKHKFIKLQKQYKNVADTDLYELLNNALKNNAYHSIFYEIVVEVHSDRKREIKEFTFSSSGGYLTSRILKTSSYEHILY